MALYYLPVLIRSDRYFITRLQPSLEYDSIDFNFVIPAVDRVLNPLLTLEDPGKLVLNQMAPSDKQDITLRECRISMIKTSKGFELHIRRNEAFSFEKFHDVESGLRMDYSTEAKRITVGCYKYRVEQSTIRLDIVFIHAETEVYRSTLAFTVAPSTESRRMVIDFGSEASQIGYKGCGPQAAVVPYDLLGNIISQLNVPSSNTGSTREDFLNNEQGQPTLYRSFYAVRKKIGPEARASFPFNFTNDIVNDEIRLFITRKEVSATTYAFREEYEIIPNLKLGIERSIQLTVGNKTEDYSIRYHKKELISAILLRMLRLVISTKPDFRHGGMIVTLLVPNIYTQHDVFELLNELSSRTASMLQSMQIIPGDLSIEYETISESDAAFMGYQQTHGEEARLSNGEIALVIDCGKGTTDISMLLADDNENYSSFFRTGFAGAGNVLLYGFVEDFLVQVLRAIPGNNDKSVKDFINRHILDQNLTADVLNFIQLMEDRKKRYKTLPAIGLGEFSQLAEQYASTERTIGTLHRDPSTLLQYADTILRDRGVRWDDEVTGLVQKAVKCIIHSIIASIRDVITPDIRKRIRVVMLSGRAFYFDDLRKDLENSLRDLLGNNIRIQTVPPGRALNNKNVAMYGAFTGAYKITDFTGIPIDRKEGLSRNKDVLNNNLYLYRGIKIEPGNDILYNDSVVRRNHQDLKAFKNKTVDIYFTRDNVYMRLLENQRVKYVQSLYGVLTTTGEGYSSLQDLKAISMFPTYSGELASVQSVFEDMVQEKGNEPRRPVRKRQGILQFFQF